MVERAFAWLRVNCRLLKRYGRNLHYANAWITLSNIKRVLFLPSYSPDFNPIELTFSNPKTWLRTAQVRTREALDEAIRAAMNWVSVDDTQNWFAHCGYHVH